MHIARDIIDNNLYMTLATTTPDGMPWATPVFFSAAGYRDFYWISAHEAQHSRNIAAQPQVRIVIFDSHVAPGTGQAAYISARAWQLDTAAEVEQALNHYPGPIARGGSVFSPKELAAPSAFRLYVATASQLEVLCTETARPCSHGFDYQHRVAVSP